MAPLSDPRWLGALALLVVNDWALKPLAAAGLFPDGLSGKLSDFAGLIVAVVLLAAVATRLGLCRHVARSLATLLVATLFVAVNVSVDFAAALDVVARGAGLPIRSWSDPTDLVALVVVPLAWRILDQPRPGGSPKVEVGAAIAGAIACLATSWEGKGDPLSPAIANATDIQIVVTARQLDVALDCDLVDQADTQLTLDDFGHPTSFTLEPTESYGLPGDYPDEGAEEICGAALVQVGPFLEATLVAWRTSRSRQGGWSSANRDDPPAGTVYVSRVGDQLFLVPGEGMYVFPAPEAAQ